MSWRCLEDLDSAAVEVAVARRLRPRKAAGDHNHLFDPDTLDMTCIPESGTPQRASPDAISVMAWPVRRLRRLPGGSQATLGIGLTMTEQKNATEPSTSVAQPNTGDNPTTQSDTAGTQLEATALKVEKLIRAFSQPASVITGRVLSFIGLALVVTTFVLGIVHLLGSEDFVASIISGAALSIAGIAMITTDDIRAQRAVAGLISPSAIESLKKEVAARWSSTS
jgi:hypothetical protein